MADEIVDPGDIFLMEESTFTLFANTVTNSGGMSVLIKLDIKAADIDVD